ncbi:hypothetical protein [Polaromonas sp. YR568]|uniref:hypothetical protein n=1 Tax=Polaromonas sp. YR568 TaxID=1855301 RepID=UPI00398C1213
MTDLQIQTEPRFAFRISTALLCVGLVFWPWATHFLPRPDLLDHGGYPAFFFDFVVYHFSGSVFFFALVAALVSLIWFACQRQWRAVVQSLIEMVVAGGAGIFLPAY